MKWPACATGTWPITAHLPGRPPPAWKVPILVKWLKRLDDELDNLRLLLEWALANNVEAGLRLIIQIDLFWYQRGHVREQYEWINNFLERPEAQALPAAACAGPGNKKHHPVSTLATRSKAQACAEMSLALACEIGDRREQAASLYQLGYIAANQGEAATGRKLYEESLALFREVGDRLGQARVLAQLGYMAFGTGDLAATIYRAKPGALPGGG